MAASIQKLASQAFRTFSKKYDASALGDALKNLKELMKTITPRDLNIEEPLLESGGAHIGGDGMGKAGVAPVTYMHLWEDSVFTMGVFFLKSGTSIPLHDHPGMYGLIKILYGNASIQTYTAVKSYNSHRPSDEKITIYPQRGAFDMGSGSSADTEYSIDDLPFGWKIAAVKKPLATVSSQNISEPCILTPDECNFHEIRAHNGPVAFLDILSPPYDHDTLERVCHYYQEVALPVGAATRPDICTLKHIEQPSEFWCDSLIYTGPKIALHEEST